MQQQIIPACKDPESGKYIILLDASSLRKMNCMLKWQLSVFYGYRETIMSNDVEYGSAMHHFLEAFLNLPAEKRKEGFMSCAASAQEYFRNKPMTQKPEKAYLDEAHLSKSCFHFATGEYHKLTEYWEPLVSPIDNKPLLEVKFAIPYHSDSLMDIILCGTMDAVVRSKRNPNLIAVCDFKTTSARKTSEYLNGYRLSSQLMLYVHALKHYIARGEGEFWQSLSNCNVGAFIFGLFPQAPSTKGSSVTPIKCEQSQLFMFSEEQLDEFKILLNAAVADIMLIVKDYHIRGNSRIPKEGTLTGYCQQPYGSGCLYFGACCAPDDEAMFSILESRYKKTFYDPRTFGGGDKNTKVT